VQRATEIYKFERCVPSQLVPIQQLLSTCGLCWQQRGRPLAYCADRRSPIGDFMELCSQPSGWSLAHEWYTHATRWNALWFSERLNQLTHHYRSRFTGVETAMTTQYSAVPSIIAANPRALESFW
jgi:hypothetical protein